MNAFTPAEFADLPSQGMGRIATAGPDGQPHAVPVVVRYNPDHDAIETGGHGLARTKKDRDILRNPRVVFVVDDVASVEPWRVRGIEVRGEAEILTTGGEVFRPGFSPELVRIRPRRIVSSGLDDEV
jgi:pyridoxamine 5'-phosphate oxidase family protein